MTKPRLNLSLTTVENGGLLVEERLSPCRQYVFTSPRGFYEWLCQEMGVNAKPDSPTHDGRVVVDANKLERLERIEKAAQHWVDQPYSNARISALEQALAS